MALANKFSVKVGAREFQVEVISRHGNVLRFVLEGVEHQVVVAATDVNSVPTVPSNQVKLGAAKVRESTASDLRAPIPGIISDIKVRVGDQVKVGDTILVIEAMKMENPIKSPRSGSIKEILAIKGGEVQSGTVLVKFDS
jgi:biotin carboxyl carrier protein